MKLADFFVELGMEGDDEVVKGFGVVDSSIKGTTMAVGAFIATMAGAFYGMARLTRSASQTGAEYKKFQSLTGVNTKQLQEWETAARKASVSEESLRSSIVGVQDAITQMQTGGGAPKGLVFLQELEGFDPSRMNDAFYMLSQIQRLSQKLDPAMMREFAGSFGIDSEMLSAMRLNAFTASNMKGGASLADREIDKLHLLSGRWNEIFHDLEITGSRFASRFGNDVIDIIEVAIEKIEDFSDLILELSKDKDFVDGLTGAFDAMKSVIQGIFDLMVTIVKSDFFKSSMEFMGSVGRATTKSLKSEETYTGNKNGIVKGGLVDTALRGIMDSIVRFIDPSNPNVSNKQENNFYIQESKDGKSTANEVQRMLNTTYSAKAGGLSE